MHVARQGESDRMEENQENEPEQRRGSSPKRSFELAGSPISVRQVSDEIDIWMNSIMRDTRAICRSHELPPQHRETLDTIYSNMSRMYRAKNNLLDCLLAEANELTFQPAPHTFRAHLIPTFKELTAVAHKKGVDVEFKIDSSVPEYLIYEGTRLRQVLFNLIGNAIARTDEGEVQVNVTRQSLGRRHSDAIDLEISVSNTSLLDEKQSGPSPYQTFREINNSILEEWRDATGLTQAITKQLIKLMDGRIWTSLEPGHESVLHFTASMKQDIPALDTMILDISKYEDNRTLIIDDNPHGSDSVEDMLADFPLNTLRLNPADVLSAQNTTCPSQLIPSAPFEAIIVSSVEVLRKIREMPILNLVPVILLCSDESLDLSSILHLDTSSYFISSRNRFDLGHSIHKAFGSIPLPVKCRVLAAEPDKVNRLLLKRILESFDFGEPTVCEDGRQAFQYFTKQRYDVVFMQFAGPKTYGEAAAKRIRAFERDNGISHTPLIALAPRSFQASGITIPDIFDGYIEHPIWKKDLGRTIIRWIRKSRSPGNWEEGE
ncbi:hypothetical protein PRK78_002282 [Emydomyces testavorans]|uniref:Histidine kinase/HSP90-like ATPase domain-containing protein n=1 Tax=Emydomyces testavorans TaxID=2070801 RepID=A0AAF0DG25_9EURO|nr:hypothetical protein PRK78_002282 [Emydomyces testavorans]